MIRRRLGPAAAVALAASSPFSPRESRAHGAFRSAEAFCQLFAVALQRGQTWDGDQFRLKTA